MSLEQADGGSQLRAQSSPLTAQSSKLTMSRPSSQSVAIVPAAGRSERFGGAKLLADVAGEPLLEHTLRCLLDGGVSRVVVVVAPAAQLASVPLLTDPRVTVVTNPDPSRGMFSSIQTGLASGSGEPFVVLPADMPFVRPETVAAVLAETARRDAAVVRVFRGRRGHPLGVPGRLRDGLLAADPRGSLKDALAALEVTAIAIDTDDPGVVRDVDRREDLP